MQQKLAGAPGCHFNTLAFTRNWVFAANPGGHGLAFYGMNPILKVAWKRHAVSNGALGNANAQLYKLCLEAEPPLSRLFFLMFETKYIFCFPIQGDKVFYFPPRISIRPKVSSISPNLVVVWWNLYLNLLYIHLIR